MAKELINITPSTSGNGFDIPFPNGKVTIPDTPGGYCISSGCGSGKTESIKSLIRQKFPKGILYCVDTVAECQKMHQWVIDELVTPGTISATDVMMINSKADLESMKTYQDHPEKICEVPILIVVQVRFFVELINYFLLYKPKTKPQPFDGDFRSLMVSPDMRTYIVFDETPLFLKPFATLTKGELSPYVIDHNGCWVCKSPQEIWRVYDSFIKGDPKMDYNRKEHILARTMNSVVLSMIPRLFTSWMAQKGKEYHIQYWPSDLVQLGMRTHVLIYEGAGDILLGNNSKFKLLDVPKKYNSTVYFYSFGFGLSRKAIPTDQEYSSFVVSVHNILNTCQGKTLIIIWKDFKGGLLSEKSDNTYVTKLQDALISDGVPAGSFAVTYYGAADTKSTNSYRDCKNVILCGRWGLGDNVIHRLKRGFDCQTACMENYMMWYYVQLVLRIGIRNNNGGKYHIYYSSDHEDTFIFRLSAYLNQNIFIPQKVKAGTPLWEALIQNYKMGKKYLPDLRKLVGHDSGLKIAIEAGQQYIYTVPLKDIARLIPKKKKPQKDNYKGVIGFLEKINVKLQITR